MSNELIPTLIQTTIALTVALLLALLLRTVLRRQFGAPHGYAVWLLVPLLPLTCLLPLLIPRANLPLPALHLPAFTTNAIALAPTSTIDTALLITALWIIGILFSLGLLYWRQMQFMRSLGRIEKIGDIYTAQAHDICPALVGILRPKIVVPGDFASRYTAIEQVLILAHERQHRQRGDNWANAMCALLQSVFWFHPLIHFCAARFRFDQELACDALVIRHHRNARKTYANAMLKTKSLQFDVPVACTWQSRHFLKERIMQINVNTPHSMKRHIGSALLITLITLGTCVTWAAQSTPTKERDKKGYDVTTTVTTEDGKATNSTIHVLTGESFALVGGAADKWSGTVKLTAPNEKSVKFEVTLAQADKIIGHPILISHNDEIAKIEYGNGSSKFTMDIKAKPTATTSPK
ncbi:M56 family metallopeptidase [Solimicrobium silvestre]|uniref:Antirepressor regulating drug resistance predicted signal transduction N-terminal membrane component n=1 Tax=Solimicrobium silvestre TaxID=2099400 RepID=A0A2S9GT75_9BURK|nr:M56 family metallopeptidase [Solimicrobium silvestre]PRC90901.1 Antirepressor regulating drug resistance predicted signal transduction N-terminal membrane component [Solimicrobium silvestre]